MDTRRVGADPVELLRTLVLVVLVIGLLGTVTELVLLEHYEQALQLGPVALIAAALVAIVWQVVSKDAASLRALEIVMYLFVLAGFAGVIAHFYGSAE